MARTGSVEEPVCNWSQFIDEELIQNVGHKFSVFDLNHALHH